MSVDAYEDHIRYLGYHVPLDTSKLPPTTRANLVDALNGEADDALTEDDLKDAADTERKRILDLVDTYLIRIERAIDDEESLKSARAAVSDLRDFVDEAGE